MLRTDEILSTIQMLHAEHLDVRTRHAGTEPRRLRGAEPGPPLPEGAAEDRLAGPAGWSRSATAWGPSTAFPVINKRLAISPAATLLAGHGHGAAVQVAKTLDAGGGRVPRRFRRRLHGPGPQGDHRPATRW